MSQDVVNVLFLQSFPTLMDNIEIIWYIDGNKLMRSLNILEFGLIDFRIPGVTIATYNLYIHTYRLFFLYFFFFSNQTWHKFGQSSLVVCCLLVPLWTASSTAAYFRSVPLLNIWTFPMSSWLPSIWGRRENYRESDPTQQHSSRLHRMFSLKCSKILHW